MATLSLADNVLEHLVLESGLPKTMFRGGRVLDLYGQYKNQESD